MPEQDFCTAQHARAGLPSLMSLRAQLAAPMQSLMAQLLLPSMHGALPSSLGACPHLALLTLVLLLPCPSQLGVPGPRVLRAA